jgi:hypothetical protein
MCGNLIFDTLKLKFRSGATFQEKPPDNGILRGLQKNNGTLLCMAVFTIQINIIRLEDYSNRFEVPNPRNRWDRPLITIREGNKLPWDDIKNVLLENPETVTRNEATEYVRNLFLSSIKFVG